MEKVYFPIPPFCKKLSKEIKNKFHNSVDRGSAKSKLIGLIENSQEIIEKMEYEQHQYHFMQRNRIIGFLAMREHLWLHLAIVTNLLLNFFIMFSYYDRCHKVNNGKELVCDKYSEPRLFYFISSIGDRITATPAIIRWLGYSNLLFSLMQVIFFLIKRTPLHYSYI